MDEDRRKHLEFIQAIIGRMAQCSFLIKGWSITLIAALFALAAKDANPRFVVIAYFPAATFWWLNGYFLFQERLFRYLYCEAVSGRAPLYELNASQFEGESRTWAKSTFSLTLFMFHGALMFTILVVMFWLNLGV